MTNQNIFDAALRLACEVETAGENLDYAERACYLLPTVCAQYAGLDAAYRSVFGEEQQSLPTSLCYTLSAGFPLTDRFAPAASALLASLLVADEAPTLCKHLQEQADALCGELQRALPFRREATVNAYPHLL